MFAGRRDDGGLGEGMVRLVELFGQQLPLRIENGRRADEKVGIVHVRNEEEERAPGYRNRTNCEGTSSGWVVWWVGPIGKFACLSRHVGGGFPHYIKVGRNPHHQRQSPRKLYRG